MESQWYGWIPTLTEKEPHVLMDHPIPESTRYFQFTLHERDPKVFYADVTVKKVHYTIDIAIHKGFVVMMFNGMDEGTQKTVANLLFATLIGHYHVDVTHDSDNGLTPVNARNPEEASQKIVEQILSISEDFIYLARETESVDSLKRVYLNSLGMVEYGKAFIHMYENELGKLIVEECKERLESMSRFIDAIYGTVRDSIQDNLAHRSQEMSESMENLSRNTETLSIAVLGLTWFSAVIALASLSMNYEDITTPSIWSVGAVAIVPPITIFIVHRIIRHYQ